jgi:hypothetical protein
MPTLVKRFSEWILRKTRLDNSTRKPPLVSERDLWWVAIGENVGQEIGGKGKEFTRPAVVLSLDSKLGQIDTTDFARVCEGFAALYLPKNDPPPFGGSRS